VGVARERRGRLAVDLGDQEAAPVAEVAVRRGQERFEEAQQLGVGLAQREVPDAALEV